MIIVVPYQRMKPQTRSSSAGRKPKRSVVAVERGLAVGLFCVVVLSTFDGCPRFIEQRVGTREVAAVERVNGVVAGFDRLLVVLGTVLRPRRR
jgi:hypothetical protein